MHTLGRHISVIVALIIRDLMGRFGRSHLGFVWTVLEPIILTSGVMLLWSVIKEPTIHGLPVLTFILTGYMPLTLWRHLTNPMARILRNNAALLYHAPVSSMHVLLARTVLEFLSVTSALVTVYFVVVSIGLVEPMQNPGLLLASWLLGGWYFGAMGLVIAVVTEFWEPADKFVQPMQYLALPLSGAFFLLDWLPEYAQRLLLINPSVNYFEMFRAGFIGPAVTTHYSALYLTVCAAVATVVGVAGILRVRDRMQYV